MYRKWRSEWNERDMERTIRRTMYNINQPQWQWQWALEKGREKNVKIKLWGVNKQAINRYYSAGIDFSRWFSPIINRYSMLLFTFILSLSQHKRNRAAFLWFTHSHTQHSKWLLNFLKFKYFLKTVCNPYYSYALEEQWNNDNSGDDDDDDHNKTSQMNVTKKRLHIIK